MTDRIDVEFGARLTELQGGLRDAVAEVRRASGQIEESLEQMQRRTSGSADSSSASLGGLASTVVAFVAGGALASLVNQSIDLGDSLSGLSVKTGVSVEALSGLKFVAEQNGSSLDSLSGALSVLGRNMLAAAQGGEKQQQIFSDLGVEYKNLDGTLRTGDATFIDVIDKLSQIDNVTQRAATAQQVMGKSAGSLAGVLAISSKEMQEQIQYARDLGLIMSEEDAKAADAFRDAQAALGTATQNLVLHALAPCLDSLQDIVYASLKAAKSEEDLGEQSNILGTILKWVAVVGGSVATAFKEAGLTIGATAAAVALAADGDFAAARQVFTLLGEDIERAEAKFAAFRADLYADNPDLPSFKRGSEGGIQDRSGGKDTQQAAKKVADERLKILQEELQRERDYQIASINYEEQSLANKAALGQVSKQDAIVLAQELADRKYEIEADLVVKLAGLSEQTALQQAQSASQISQIYNDRNLEALKSAGELNLAVQQQWEGVLQPISTAIEGTVNGFIAGTLTMRQAVTNLGSAILSAFVSAGAKSLVSWAANQFTMTGATVAGVTARGIAEKAGAKQSLLTQAGTSLKKIFNDSKEVFAGVFANLSGSLGPFAVIPAGIAAGAVLAVGSGIVSARGGYDIPSGVNPLVQTHEKEMILPSGPADTLRYLTEMVKGGGGSAAQGPTIHYYAPHEMTERMIRDNAAVLLSVIKEQISAGHYL